MNSSTGNPSSAHGIAGSTSAFQGFEPKRSWSAATPGMNPGRQAIGSPWASPSIPGGKVRNGGSVGCSVPILLRYCVVPVCASKYRAHTVPVWLVMSICTVACVMQPATTASAAFPPARMTSSIVRVTIGL